MYLTRHETPGGPRWALDGQFLPESFTLGLLLQLPASAIAGVLQAIPRSGPATGALLAPLEADHEVWACGVTYLRSREAREAESTVRDVYARVYDATRPELFFKGVGWRTVGHQAPIRVRDDSTWNVPEPELTLVVNAAAEIVGYTVGNDVSSRDIAESRCGVRAAAGGCAWRWPKLPKDGWRGVAMVRDAVLRPDENPPRKEPLGRASAGLAATIATTIAMTAAKRLRLNMSFTVVR